MILSIHEIGLHFTPHFNFCLTCAFIEQKPPLKISLSHYPHLLLRSNGHLACLSHSPKCVFEFILSVVPTLCPVSFSPCQLLEDKLVYASKRKLSVVMLRNSKFAYPILRMFYVSLIWKEVFRKTKSDLVWFPVETGWIRSVYLWALYLCQCGIGLLFLPGEHCIVPWSLGRCFCVVRTVVHTSVRYNTCAGEWANVLF